MSMKKLARIVATGSVAMVLDKCVDFVAPRPKKIDLSTKRAVALGVAAVLVEFASVRLERYFDA